MIGNPRRKAVYRTATAVMRTTENRLESGWSDAPGLGYYWGAIRRQIGVLVAVPLTVAIIGFVFVVTAEPLYTARAELRLETEGEVLSEIVSPFNTHIELIRSDRLTRTVIHELDLAEDFAGSPSCLQQFVSRIRHGLGLEQDDGEEIDSSALTVANVQAGLSADRLSNTSLIEVAYTSASRGQAAAIANAYAEAYLDYTNGREARRLEAQLTRMEDRAAGMETLAAEAFRRAQEIIAQNGFAVTSVMDLRERIADLRRNLSQIASEEAVLKERLDAFMELQGDEKLRWASFLSDGSTKTYFELQQNEEQLADLQDRSAVPRETLTQLRDAIAAKRDSLDQAFDRAQGELEAERSALRARRNSVEAVIEELQEYGQSPEWTDLLVTERKGATYEDLYQTYLTRIEDLYRQGADSPLRLVSEAVIPAAPSFPNYKVAFAISIALGLAAGICLALMREWRRRPAAQYE